MVDSRLPRFSQALQALLLGAAFLLDAAWVVPVLAVVLIAASVGGPSWNALAYVYRALPIPPGEMEPAAPPRFAQSLGAAFLTLGTIGLYSATRDTTVWWALGWGPALAVAVLAALAASTAF
ncbi:MAG TPA: DUF4395 family protein [Actinomycetota bacterium]|nr:DUF4395 family protein [Actinomycetota bacterium]